MHSRGAAPVSIFNTIYHIRREPTSSTIGPSTFSVLLRPAGNAGNDTRGVPPLLSSLFLLPHVSSPGRPRKILSHDTYIATFLYLLGRNDRSGVSVLGREIPPSPIFMFYFPWGLLLCRQSTRPMIFISTLRSGLES